MSPTYHLPAKDEAVYLSDKVVVMTARPGQIKAILDVDIPRPRELSVKRSAPFLRLVDQIWSMIEEEVKASRYITGDGRPMPMPAPT